jgi:hypothetical protein
MAITLRKRGRLSNNCKGFKNKRKNEDKELRIYRKRGKKEGKKKKKRRTVNCRRGNKK